LGDLLQHVIVERPEQALAGLALVRERNAGRCGFLITSAVAPAYVISGLNAAASVADTIAPPNGLIALSSIVAVTGPHAVAIRQAIGEAWIADSYDAAVSATVSIGGAGLPIVTRSGDVFRGPHLVTGGSGEQARGILETKREIRELRDRVQAGRDALSRLAEETSSLE